MITELDVNVLPNPEKFGGAEISQNFKYADALNPYKNGLPEDVEKEFEKRYLDIFNIYYRHRGQISRVTLWGVTDTRSWLNDFPVPGRVNYPLLFDRSNKPKPVVDKIIKDLGDMSAYVSKGYIYDKIKERTGLSTRHISRILNHTKRKDLRFI